MLPRLVIFISGSGTNLQAILDAVDKRQLEAEVALVVSNRKAAYGLVRAAQAGVPSVYFPLKSYLDQGLNRETYDLDLAERVKIYQPDLVVLAGWMHILSAHFLDQFPDQVINLHPALPDLFPGTEAIHRTYDAYQRGEVEHGGCMVHYVVPEVDAGPVIAQAIVPIEPTDTPDSFEARMHATEHRLIVEAVGIALDRVRVL